MSNKDQQEGLQALAEAIDEALQTIYTERMGFMLIVTPFQDREDKVSDYIGNVRRENAAEWLKETIERWENNEVIGKVEENEQ